MNRIAALALTGCLVVPPAAQADWPGTRWGMTRDEVIGATTAKAVEGSYETQVFNQDLLAQGTGRALGLPVKTQFYFNRSGALGVVREMIVDPADCPKLLAAMGERHGKPVEEEGPVAVPPRGVLTTRMWVDPASRDRIRYTSGVNLPDTDDFCFVVHTPGPPP